jgi:hypothetical protein
VPFPLLFLPVSLKYYMNLQLVATPPDPLQGSYGPEKPLKELE